MTCAARLPATSVARVYPRARSRGCAGGARARCLTSYNIIDESDLAAAVAKRFGNGEQAANIEPSTVTPDSVASSRAKS
jgi:hypothetical protein